MYCVCWHFAMTVNSAAPIFGFIIILLLIGHICTLGIGLERACNGGSSSGISLKEINGCHLNLKRFPALASAASYCSSSSILRMQQWSRYSGYGKLIRDENTNKEGKLIEVYQQVYYFNVLVRLVPKYHKAIHNV